MYKGEKVKILGVGVIIEKDDKILMIEEKLGHSDIGKEENMLSYPLKTVKFNETVVEAAERGYQEEVGLAVKVTDIIGFYQFKGGFGVSFTGNILEDTDITLATDEVTNLRWMSIDEILSHPNLRPGVRKSITHYSGGQRYLLNIITSAQA